MSIVESIVDELVFCARGGYRFLKQNENGDYVIKTYSTRSKATKSLVITVEEDQFKVSSEGGVLNNEECEALKKHVVVVIYPHLNRIGIVTHFNADYGVIHVDDDSLPWGGGDPYYLSMMTVKELAGINSILPDGMVAKLEQYSPWGQWTETLVFYRGEEIFKTWWDANSGQWESGRPTRGTSYHYDTLEQFIREEILEGKLDKPTEERIKNLQEIFGANVTIELSSCAPKNRYYDGFKLSGENGNTAVIWKYPDSSWGTWNKYPKISTSRSLEGIAEIIKDTLLD